MPHFLSKKWDTDGPERTKRCNKADLQHVVCSLLGVSRGSV